jgi:hypothetical protein
LADANPFPEREHKRDDSLFLDHTKLFPVLDQRSPYILFATFLERGLQPHVLEYSLELWRYSFYPIRGFKCLRVYENSNSLDAVVREGFIKFGPLGSDGNNTAEFYLIGWKRDEGNSDGGNREALGPKHWNSLVKIPL